jgi:hypothetical protein
VSVPFHKSFCQYTETCKHLFAALLGLQRYYKFPSESNSRFSFIHYSAFLKICFVKHAKSEVVGGKKEAAEVQGKRTRDIRDKRLKV